MVRSAVVLVGHGAPASDCPPYLVFKLKQLESRRRALGGDPSDEEQELDAKIRNWPRTAGNDPYRAGLEAVAEKLHARLPDGTELVMAFCEHCAPTLDAAVEDLVKRGFERVVVVSSMMIPGGAHSDVDVPRTIEGVSWRFPDLDIEYAWPFDTESVADLLALHLKRAARLEPGDIPPPAKPAPAKPAPAKPASAKAASEKPMEDED
jgi:sirohydrochlorin cobaltochelatase